MSDSTCLSRIIEKNLEESQFTGELFLHGRKMKCLPKNFHNYDFVDLFNADFSHNNFVDIAEEILYLYNLERLNLSYNMIRCINPNITNLDRLLELNLSNNQLFFFPPTICQLKDLQVLHLSNNKINAIPEMIFKLKSLTLLDLGNNEIASLPNQIGDLANLKELNLRKNFLIEMPICLCRLKLTKLDLSQNKIAHIPFDFTKISTLNQFNIDFNPLLSPPIMVCQKGLNHIIKFLQREYDHSYNHYNHLRKPSISGASLMRMRLKRSSSFSASSDGRFPNFDRARASMIPNSQQIKQYKNSSLDYKQQKNLISQLGKEQNCCQEQLRHNSRSREFRSSAFYENSLLNCMSSQPNLQAVNVNDNNNNNMEINNIINENLTSQGDMSFKLTSRSAINTPNLIHKPLNISSEPKFNHLSPSSSKPPNFSFDTKSYLRNVNSNLPSNDKSLGYLAFNTHQPTFSSYNSSPVENNSEFKTIENKNFTNNNNIIKNDIFYNNVNNYNGISKTPSFKCRIMTEPTSLNQISLELERQKLEYEQKKQKVEELKQKLKMAKNENEQNNFLVKLDSKEIKNTSLLTNRNLPETPLSSEPPTPNTTTSSNRTSADDNEQINDKKIKFFINSASNQNISDNQNDYSVTNGHKNSNETNVIKKSDSFKRYSPNNHLTEFSTSKTKNLTSKIISTTQTSNNLTTSLQSSRGKNISTPLKISINQKMIPKNCNAKFVKQTSTPSSQSKSISINKDENKTKISKPNKTIFQKRSSTNSNDLMNPNESSVGKASDESSQLADVRIYSEKDRIIIGKMKKLLESVLKIGTLSDSSELERQLKDGVLLCQFINCLKPRAVACIHVSSPSVPNLSQAKMKRNLENFVAACKKTGLDQNHICSVSQLTTLFNLVALANTVVELGIFFKK